MVRRLFLGILVLSCNEGLAFGQSDVRNLLEHVASAIRDRYLGGYVVSIDRHQYAKPHYGGPLGGSYPRDLSPPLPSIPQPTDGNRDRITLARSGEKLRYDLHNAFAESWQWITDNRTIWCYRRDLNAYTVTAAEPWPKVLGPGPGLPGVEWNYVTKFLAIAGMADYARLLNDDLSPSRACPGPSISLELTLTPDGKTVQELRVLSRTYLPCESITRRVARASRTVTDIDETITWTFHDEAPSPGFFVFSPRRHAKQVKKIPRTDE